MYDRAQAMSDVNLKKSSRGLRETSGLVYFIIYSRCAYLIIFVFFFCFFFNFSDEDAGIEMQVLGGSSEMPSRLSVERQSDEISCGNSAISFDYLEPSSTIG